MHGELLWEACAGFSNCNGTGATCRGNGTDGWDQQVRPATSHEVHMSCGLWLLIFSCMVRVSPQLLAGGNGEGTLFYPGRPDKIGGNDHIPVSSLRLTLIREGNEDYECVKKSEIIVACL